MNDDSGFIAVGPSSVQIAVCRIGNLIRINPLPPELPQQNSKEVRSDVG